MENIFYVHFKYITKRNKNCTQTLVHDIYNTERMDVCACACVHEREWNQNWNIQLMMNHLHCTYLTSAEGTPNVICRLGWEPTLGSQAVQLDFEHVHGVINGLDLLNLDRPWPDLFLGFHEHSWAMFIALCQDLELKTNKIFSRSEAILKMSWS